MIFGCWIVVGRFERPIRGHRKPTDEEWQQRAYTENAGGVSRNGIHGQTNKGPKPFRLGCVW